MMRPAADLSLLDRVRRLPRARRKELYQLLAARFGPAALAPLRFDWTNFVAHPWQKVTAKERRAKLIVFFGERSDGKTRAAVEYFLGEILAGRAKRPRIIASKASDVWGVVIFGESGIAKCLPPWVPVEYVPTSDEAPAGILRINGVKVCCFGAHDEEATTAYAGDLDLYDDTAKWKGERAERAYKTARVSCRIGRGVGIMATTRKGLRFVRRAMSASPEIRGELVCIKESPRHANAGNLTEGYYQRKTAELGEDALDDEADMENPFQGLAFDEEPYRAHLVGELDEIAIGIDPADGKGRAHDDWGLVAVGARPNGHLVALEDGSGDFDDAEAGAAVFAMVDRWRPFARRIVLVVENNRGPRAMSAVRAGYLARELKQLESGGARTVPPEIVPTKRDKSKALAFGAIRPLYLAGLLHHMPGLALLETQMRKCDPEDKRPKANDRIDGLVTAVHYLAQLGAGAKEAAEEAARQLEAAAACDMAARMNEALKALTGRHRAPPPGPGDGFEAMKVPSAEPGDARYAAPPAPARIPSWRNRRVL